MEPPQEHREQVLGFLMDLEVTRVVLVYRKQPNGRFDGIRGPVESGESPLDAMCRTCEEQTGVATSRTWDRFAALHHDDGGMTRCFRGFTSLEELNGCRTMEARGEVGQYLIGELLRSRHGRDRFGPNLMWLIPLAAHWPGTDLDVMVPGSLWDPPGRVDAFPTNR